MVTAAERTLELLEDLARTGATTFAVGRLLQRRPDLAAPAGLPVGSEERRVGKECRSRWSPYH